MRIVLLCFLLSLSYTAQLVGQSPANLLQDINASHGFSTIDAIENTYNNARRQEEIQLNLPTNSISNLNLPASWDNMNENAKMLYLINDERTSRAGINYGQGPVLGLPFAGVAQGVDDVSQAYAQTLFTNDAFTHSYGGTSPSSRLSAAYGSCAEFTSRSENLYASAGTANTGFPRVVEKAIYGFNYDDAGSAWGHREMSLLQNNDLLGRAWGFNNNEGDNSTEGYIGVGIYRGTNYGIFGSNPNFGVVLVLNYIDPSPSSTCNYAVIESTSSSSPGTTDPCDQPLSFSGGVTTPVVASNTSITLGANVTLTNPTTVSSPEIIVNAGFSITAGNCVQFVSDGCAYNGTLTCGNNGPGASSGTVTGSGTCASPYLISCNDAHSSSNAGQSNSWSTYTNGLSSGWTGAESIYRFTASPGSTNSISLTNLSADVDMFLTSACSNSVVLSSSTQVGLASESINFSTSSGGTFYIIIDGWNGAISLYDLNISCSAAKEADPTKSALLPVTVQKEQLATLKCEPYLVELVSN